MLKELKQEMNKALTENGAVTYASTGSDCLDLFATIGALRHQNESEIIARFVRAYTENSDLAMKLLFYARDIRGGLGERRVFRTILTWLAKHEPHTVRKNIEYISEYGRFDDLLSLLDTPCEKSMFTLIKKQFETDIYNLTTGNNISLLGKWLPSVNASNVQTVRNAKILAKALGLSVAEYRKSVTKLRAAIRIIENNLRKMDYTFDYAKQPSRAMYKYRKAFARHDEERYFSFLEEVSKGQANLHAKNVTPYELVEPFLNYRSRHSKSFMRDISPMEKTVLNATWKSLSDFCGEENSLAIIDTSASMYYSARPLPAAVALSLGLYFAEHNKGHYRNHFIEFAAKPRLIEIKGETFADRLRYVATFNEYGNTNLEAVFNLVLDAALKNNVPSHELPAKLIIISDMEFDSCVGNASNTNFDNAKAKYTENGYSLPEIVFWNVASRNRQQPVTMNEQGVVLVSGTTPRIFNMIASGSISPYTFMLQILNSDRYAPIAA